MLTSCSSDDEVEVTERCYISSASLGTLKRIMHISSSADKDSVIRSTYTGNSYPLTVNQRTLTIENYDSLLYGTDLSALLVGINYVGATVAYRPASDETSDWMSYKATDSLNLTEPLHLFTLSEDGNSYRIYTLKLNVHKVDGDSLRWSRLETTDAFENMTAMHAAIVGGQLTVTGLTESGVQQAVRSSLGSQGEWTIRNTNLLATADVEAIRQHDDVLYTHTAEGAIYSSPNGADWTEVAPAVEGLSLAAVTDNFYYAIINGRLCSSEDALTWSDERLDDDPLHLPATMLRSYVTTQSNGNRRLTLMGYRAEGTDTTAVVWSKLWASDEDEQDAVWMYINPTDDNIYQMPRLQHLNLMEYDGRGLALGGASQVGHGSHTSMDGMYFSNDHGITWKPDYELLLPKAVQGTESPMAATVDEDNYIWLILDKQVWRGRLNRLGFARQ